MAKEGKVYLVGDLAKELEVQDATVRVMLRAAGIEREGKQYEWNEAQFKRVIAQLEKGRDKPEPKAKADKPVARKSASKPKREKAEAA